MAWTVVALIVVATGTTSSLAQELSESQWQKVRDLEQVRINAIKSAMPSVVAVYGDDRNGGGSGVIIDASGLALTNHHVVMAAGVEGWGGLADGKLYRWSLIGTDPGGDVSLIQMHPPDEDEDFEFPFSPLGDSDTVRVGDWAMAMGNPFTLTEDQKPTVTLGIVSGVKRYQHGAGDNQLVYGNCIQVDSSINPGNSGGPLFNMKAEVIGINGRGSFRDRGRVNVGLGYAISANQIRNFVPDLLATKLVEHGTIDASFSDRDGAVVCSTIVEGVPAARAGLSLGDELVEFEGVPIDNANQYTNLICTYPENWPVHLKIRKPGGQLIDIHVRMFGLPYSRPENRPPEPDEESDPDTQREIRKQQEMFDLLAAEPGTVRKPEQNRNFARRIIESSAACFNPSATGMLTIVDELRVDDRVVGRSTTVLAADGRLRIDWQRGDNATTWWSDGEKFIEQPDGKPAKELSHTEAKLTLPIVQALGCMACRTESPFESFGGLQLDGSGKALNQPACRFKLTDDDEDWFYFWTAMTDKKGLAGQQLARASADIDCHPNTGGVRFDNWQQHDGWSIPARRAFVQGLGQQVTLNIIAKDVTHAAEIDEDLLRFPDSDEEPETGADQDQDQD